MLIIELLKAYEVIEINPTDDSATCQNRFRVLIQNCELEQEFPRIISLVQKFFEQTTEVILPQQKQDWLYVLQELEEELVYSVQFFTQMFEYREPKPRLMGETANSRHGVNPVVFMQRQHQTGQQVAVRVYPWKTREEYLGVYVHTRSGLHFVQEVLQIWAFLIFVK